MFVLQKSTSVCAAILLCVTLLAGCSNQSEPEFTAAEPPVTETTAAEISAETTAESTAAASSAETFDVTDAFEYEAGTPEISGDLDTVKSVTFFRDGMKIAGRLFLPEGDGDFPLVVISSGQTASLYYYEDEAKHFSENGIACLTYDSIGAVGRSDSDGKLNDSSVFTEAADLNVILDSLADLPKVDASHVFLFGHSLGGLVCTYVGCHRADELSGMILLEPSFQYPDFVRKTDPDLSKVPDIITDTRKYNTIVGKQFVIDMHALDIFEFMPDFDEPVIIYLGTENCLGSMYPEYFARAKETFPAAETVTFEDADHFFQGDDGVQMTENAIAFVQQHL